MAREAPLPRAPRGEPCLLRFADADVELARVAGASVTACDVALAALVRAREGAAGEDPRAVTTRVVREWVLSEEARARGLERDGETRRRVERTLADALVRDAARRAFVAPDAETIGRYFDEHRGEYEPRARVHVRAIALESEAEAREVLRALAAGAEFERLAAERSTLPGARRDEGDLGLTTDEGSDLVPRAVAQRAFALEEFSAIDPDPVRVETLERVGRRRVRTRVRVRWFVVQRLERLEAEPVTLDAVARRIAYRLSLSAWRSALVRARGEAIAAAAAVDSVSIDAQALSRVRLRLERPAPREPVETRQAPRRRRVAAPRRR